MTIKYLSDGGADGTVVGQSATDKIGFYGKTPIARATVTMTTSDTTGNLRIDVDKIFNAIKNLGLIT